MFVGRLTTDFTEEAEKLRDAYAAALGRGPIYPGSREARAILVGLDRNVAHWARTNAKLGDVVTQIRRFTEPRVAWDDKDDAA